MSRIRSTATGCAVACALLVAGVAATASSATLATGTELPLTARALAPCVGAPLQPPSPAAASGEELQFDVTASTSSPASRRLYEQAGLAVVERAAAEKTALRIVAVGASGVGARVLFAGSFAPVSADDVFNLAARNKELCLARQAIAAATRTHPDPLGGSDLAGALAAGIAALRQMVKPGGAMTLTQLTDGCQSPAARGPNRALTNLCGQLSKGKPAAAIVHAHPAEFRLDARGVTVVMRGVGVGRNARFANTLSAQKLVGFWTLVCLRAHARACVIGSGVL